MISQHTIISYMKELLAYSSSGIVLNYNDGTKTRKYWLSHGGIPLNKNVEDTYNILFNNKRCITLKEYREKYPYSNKSRYTSNLRWADYTTSNNFRSEGGRGQIPIRLLYKFLNENNIDFVIRGHNDNYENAYLSNDTNDEMILPLNDITIHENNKNNKFIIFPDKKDRFVNPHIKKVHQTDGYVARIKTDNWYNKDCKDYKDYFPVRIKDKGINTKVYPLLTISTNSDIYRTLNKDSFIILNMHQGNAITTSNLNEGNKYKFRNAIISKKLNNGAVA